MKKNRMRALISNKTILVSNGNIRTQLNIYDENFYKIRVKASEYFQICEYSRLFLFSKKPLYC